MSKVIMLMGWALMGIGVSITSDDAIVIPAVMVIVGALLMLMSDKEDK